MAYLPPDDRLRRQQAVTQGVQQPPMETAGAPSAPTSSAPSTGAPPAVNTGSGWTNLQDYLSANAPAAQAQGQQTAVDLTGKAQKALTTTDGTALYNASGLSPNTQQWNAPSTAPLFADENKKAAGETLQGVQDYTAPTGGIDAWLRAGSGATGAVNAVGQRYGDALRAVQGYQWTGLPPGATPQPQDVPAGVGTGPGAFGAPSADEGGHGNQPTGYVPPPPPNGTPPPPGEGHGEGYVPPSGGDPSAYTAPYAGPDKTKDRSGQPLYRNLRAWMGGA